ncbi:hypothetical protein LOZ65_005677 [Ophidiomyces ophidiicola]|nr:hypothetical protein LOZ65_005677 [Ophidiomyces ophidiicola]
MATGLENISSILSEILGKDGYLDLINNPSPEAYLAAGDKLHAGFLKQDIGPLGTIRLTQEQKHIYTQTVINAMAGTLDAVVEEAKRDTKEAYDNFAAALRGGASYWLGRDKRRYARMFNLQLSSINLILVNRLLSVNIMEQAADFDSRIVPLCADSSMPVEERVEIIVPLAKEASSLERGSSNFAAILSGWKLTFEDILLGDNLVSTSPRPSLRQVVHDLTVEPTFASGLIYLATDSFSRESAFLKISGLLATKTIEAKNASLLISAAVHETFVKIDSSWPNLGELIDQMEKGVQGLRRYWRFNANDYHEIAYWLERGAEDADIPKYMRESLGKGQKLYLEMSKRLRGYALALGAKIEGQVVTLEMPKSGPFKTPSTDE